MDVVKIIATCVEKSVYSKLSELNLTFVKTDSRYSVELRWA